MTRVPGNIIEGKSSPFPAGTYIGALGEAKTEWYASDRNSPDAKNALRLILTFKEITPVEGPNVGARPYIERYSVVAPGKNGAAATSLVDLTEIDDSAPFALQQTARMLTQLAIAWGALSRGTDGAAEVDFDQFISSLTAGAFNNRKVVFAVEQRTVESKTQKGADGKPKVSTYSGIAVFSDAEGNTEEEAPAPVAASSLRTHA